MIYRFAFFFNKNLSFVFPHYKSSCVDIATTGTQANIIKIKDHKGKWLMRKFSFNSLFFDAIVICILVLVFFYYNVLMHSIGNKHE